MGPTSQDGGPRNQLLADHAGDPPTGQMVTDGLRAETVNENYMRSWLYLDCWPGGPVALNQMSDAEEPEPGTAESGSAKYCEDCEMWLNGPTQWEDRKIGKKHRKNVKKGDKAASDSSPNRSVTVTSKDATKNLNPDDDAETSDSGEEGDANRSNGTLAPAPTKLAAPKEYTKICITIPLFACLRFRIWLPTFRRKLLPSYILDWFGSLRWWAEITPNYSSAVSTPAGSQLHDIN